MPRLAPPPGAYAPTLTYYNNSPESFLWIYNGGPTFHKNYVLIKYI